MKHSKMYEPEELKSILNQIEQFGDEILDEMTNRGYTYWMAYRLLERVNEHLDAVIKDECI